MYFETKGSSSRKSTKQTRIRLIILDRYAVYQALVDYEDHCPNLKNTPYPDIGYAVYENLVNMKNELVLVLIRCMTSTAYAVSISKTSIEFQDIEDLIRRMR